MRDRMSARRQAMVMFFLLVMFGTLAVGYLLTFHLDTVRRMVQQQMLNAFGPHLQVGEIQVTFLPFPQLTLTDFQVLESEHGLPIVEVSEIHMNLSFLSVLQDEVVPKGLDLQNPKVYLRRNEQGQWNTDVFLQSQPAASTGVGALLAGYSLTIENGVIQITDAWDVVNPETLDLQNIEMQLSKLSPVEPMDISLSANLNQEGDSNFSIQGTISEAQDFFTVPPAGEKPQGPHVDVRTRFDLKEGDLAQLVQIFRLKDIPTHSHGRLRMQGRVEYAPVKQGFALTLSDVIVLTDAIDAQGQVNIVGLHSSLPPTFSATWTSAQIGIHDLLKMIPAHLLPDEIHVALANRPLDGKIEVVTATLSGAIPPGEGIGLIGEFKLTEGYVDLGKTWGKAENVQGTVVLQANGAHLKAFTGTYDTIPIISASGDIEFRDEGPWLSTELHGRVPSKKLLDFLGNLFEWKTPNHVMAEFRGEQGGGELKIRLAGPLQQPDRLAVVQAQYDPQAVTLRIPGLAGPIANVSGTINFSSQVLRLTSLQGVLQSSPLTVEGSINFNEAPAFDNFQIGGRVFTKDLQTQFKEIFTPYQDMVSGSVTFVSTLSGPLDRPRIQTLWNLENLDIKFAGGLYKKLHVKGTLNANFEVGGGQGLKVHRMILDIPPLTLSANGFYDGGKTGQFTASMAAPSFDVQSLPNGLTLFDGVIRKGSLELSLKLDGKGNNWRQWRKGGSLTLKNGELLVDGLNSPVSNVLFRAKLAGHDAEVQALQFHMQDSEARIVGVIKNWDATPQVTFHMNAPKFDIDLLVPKGERSPVRDALESIAATYTVGGNLNFVRAWYKDLQFQNLKARLRIKNGLVGVDQITAQTESGSVEGRFLVNLPVQQPATVKTWITMKNIPFQALQTTFFSEEDLGKRMVTGNLSLQGMLQGHGKDPRGVLPTLNGEMKFLVTDGRIQRGTIIPKMLAIMNLPAVLQGKVDLKKEGYPFTKQSGTITITNGIMASQDIVMDGPILKLTGAGTYNLVEDQLDLAVAASPLGPYFNLLKKISLFRILLEGDQESIDMALFNVKGPLHDPSITPLPLESFKTGLTGFAKLAFNVLKNTVALPKTILFPKKTEESTQPSKADTVKEPSTVE